MFGKLNKSTFALSFVQIRKVRLMMLMCWSLRRIKNGRLLRLASFVVIPDIGLPVLHPGGS